MSNKLILGTVQFGLDYGINNLIGKPTSDQVFEMLEFAASHDIKVLDTADSYGNATELLGIFNISHPGLFSINTKFKNNQKSLEKQLIETLDLLHLTDLNTYFYHNYYDFLTQPELLIELLDLKNRNQFRKIGVSIYDNDEFRTVINTPEIDVIQFPFNLLDNYYQRGNLIKLAKEKGKELQVRSVFLQGLFFKKVQDIPKSLYPLKPYLHEIKEISSEYLLPIEQLALLYVLQQPEIDNIIIGVDNLEQLKYNVKICLKCLAPEIINKINQITVKETELLYPKNWN